MVENNEDTPLASCRKEILFDLKLIFCGALLLCIVALLIDIFGEYFFFLSIGFLSFMMVITGVSLIFSHLHKILNIIAETKYYYWLSTIYVFFIPFVIFTVLTYNLNDEKYSSFLEILVSASYGSEYVITGQFLFDPISYDVLLFVITPLVFTLFIVRQFLFLPETSFGHSIWGNMSSNQFSFRHNNIPDFSSCLMIVCVLSGFVFGFGLDDGCGKAHYYAEVECDPDYVRSVDELKEMFPDAADEIISGAIIFSWVILYWKVLLFSVFSAFIIRALIKLGWRRWPVAN